MTAPRSEAIATARVALGLSVDRLCLDALALGGCLLDPRLDAYLRGFVEVGDEEADILAQALNERLVAAGSRRRVAFSDELARTDSQRRSVRLGASPYLAR